MMKALVLHERYNVINYYVNGKLIFYSSPINYTSRSIYGIYTYGCLRENIDGHSKLLFKCRIRRIVTR